MDVILHRIDKHQTGAVTDLSTECALALRDSRMQDPEEVFLDELRANVSGPCYREGSVADKIYPSQYDEVRIGDIYIEELAIGVSAVSFGELSYARIKGERRLVKMFDGEDEDERKIEHPVIFSAKSYCSVEMIGMAARAKYK